MQWDINCNTHIINQKQDQRRPIIAVDSTVFLKIFCRNEERVSRNAQRKTRFVNLNVLYSIL